MNPLSHASAQQEDCRKTSPCPSDACSCLDCAEIRDTSRLIGPLMDRKCSALSRINARTDLLTTKFPVEVICHIFAEVSQSYLTHNSERLLQERDGSPSFHFLAFSPWFPLFLGSICRRWRSIAWSYPSLWNTLEIDLSLSGHNHGPDIVAEWLARSGALPLDIRVVERGLPELRSGQTYLGVEVLGVIKKFASRWRRLEILADLHDSMFNPEKAILPDTRNHDRSSHSWLQHLVLHAQDDYEIPIHKVLSTNHWKNLTHVELSDVDANTIWAVLERISNTSALTHLSLRCMTVTSEELPQHTFFIFYMPNLLSLSFSMDSWHTDILCNILDRLKTPRLNTLQTSFRQPSSVASFNGLLARSGCCLQRLSITDYSSAKTTATPGLRDSITQSFSSLSWLTELHINVLDSDIITRFLDVLAQNGQGADDIPILPRLRHLILEKYGSINWESVARLFVEDLSIVCRSRSPTVLSIIPKPSRDLVQVSICGSRPTMNITDRGGAQIVESLILFASLWRQHGIRFKVKMGLQGDQIQRWQAPDWLAWPYLELIGRHSWSSPDRNEVLKALMELEALPLDDSLASM